KTKNKITDKNRFDIIDYLINKLGIINFKNKFIENIEKANGNRQNDRNKLPVLSIKKIKLSDGRLDYFHKDIKYNVRNVEIDIKKFTTANKNNFSGDLKADLTGDGKLKFTFFSSLEKNWNFSPTSLNMDGDIEVVKLNLLDFKKIILKNLPNEIDNGKLNYSSKFNLNKGKIVGSNLILIEKIKIGKATEKNSLVPLKLGVNILKDRNDNLKLEIPISGNFNNPKFNIYQVILEALKNILIKAVASPADFVWSSFDIGDEKDLFVEYEYLNSNFENKDNETLEKVAEILENKEPINIIFTLFTDKEIEKNLLNTKLKKEMLLKKNIKNEILEEKINKLIEERKEKIETYFRNKKLESRIKVQISDVSRDKPITSIEFVIKNLKEN
ncbi:MAG: DUF748 domain-containing protein, partial [Psychrilyobacter sp.]|uniref:DUF748 domain-containing protein n=1 Tax=Psychrilyobacter sp. TaxID=2586924 RepID=UPI003C72B840